MSEGETQPPPKPRTRRWLLGGSILLFIALLALAPKVLLLFFAAVLFGVFLRGLTTWLAYRTGLGERWAYTLVLLGLLGLTVLTIAYIVPRLSDQVQRLAAELPKAWQHLQKQIQQSSWGQGAQRLLPNFQQQTDQEASKMMSRASGILSTTFGAVADLVILLFVGIYLAADPRRYVEGVVRLVPQERRDGAREVMDAIGVTLQRWLTGRMLLMSTNAAATTLGLWLLGVPLPVVLGLLSGLLNFIPNIGPILAAVPAVLLAFTMGYSMALYVILFYFAYQMLDGYVFTPLVEKRTVSLAPAMTIMAQVLAGVLLGAMGVVLAVPIAAVILVLVKMVYIEDTLHEKARLPGQARAE